MIASCQLHQGVEGAWYDQILCLPCAGRVGAEDATFPAEYVYYSDAAEPRCPRCGSSRIFLHRVEED